MILDYMMNFTYTRIYEKNYLSKNFMYLVIFDETDFDWQENHTGLIGMFFQVYTNHNFIKKI